MPRKYSPSTKDRNGYTKLEDLPRSPDWMQRDRKKDAQNRLQQDVHDKDSQGLVDVVQDVAGVTPPGMFLSSVGQAGEAIRQDPGNPRSYLEAVRRFGESGAVDPDKGGAVSNAMIPTAGNIGKFREEMLKKLGKAPGDASRGELTKAYLEVRRPVLTTATGGNVAMSPLDRATANRVYGQNTLGSSYPLNTDDVLEMIDPDVRPDKTYSNATWRNKLPTVKAVPVATHELIHGAQRYRRPEMFDDYVEADVDFGAYQNHPVERQAQQAAKTAEADYEKFQRKFVNSSGKNKYNQKNYKQFQKSVDKDLKNWLDEGYDPAVFPVQPSTPRMEMDVDDYRINGPVPEARNWIDPKGKTHNLGDSVLDPKFQFHEDWIDENYGGPTREAIRDGYIRESDNVIDVADPADPRLSLPLRRAGKKASEAGEPVFVNVPPKRGSKFGGWDYQLTPQELNEAYYDLPTALAEQKKKKYRSKGAPE